MQFISIQNSSSQVSPRLGYKCSQEENCLNCKPEELASFSLNLILDLEDESYPNLMERLSKYRYNQEIAPENACP